MSSDARRAEIANYVTERGEVRIDDLVTAFGVSRMTIHRHVEELARRGMLRKLHGAVSAQPSGVYEALFSYRHGQSADAKAAIAAATAAELRPGQVVVLDDSTTVAALLPHLAQATPISVVTNSLSNAVALGGVQDLHLIVLGGEFHPTYNAFIGHLCETSLSQIRVDVAFCSASAISGSACLVQDAQVTRVKQAMMAAANRKVLMVDSTKLGKVALHLLADLSAFDAIYTDADLPQELLDHPAMRRVSVIKVDGK